MGRTWEILRSTLTIVNSYRLVGNEHSDVRFDEL